MKRNEKLGGAAAAAIVVLAVHTVYANSRRKGAKTITNNSGKTIYYKPENGGEALPIAPYGSCTAIADGVATAKYKDRVYKFSDGVRVIVNKDGSITDILDSAYFWEIPIYPFRTKWLNSSPDKGWDNLFEKAKII
jgi:hypothetical protein